MNMEMEMEKKSLDTPPKKTRKNRPTACRGLNKTNCIFPCKYVKDKFKRHRNFCHAKIKRMIAKASTKKEKKRMEKKARKITAKLNKAENDIKNVNKVVKETAKEVTETPGIFSSITNVLGFKETAPIPEPATENVVVEEIKEEPEGEVKKEEEMKLI